MSVVRLNEVDMDDLVGGYHIPIHAPLQVPECATVKPLPGQHPPYQRRELAIVLGRQPKYVRKRTEPDTRPPCSVDACPRKAGRERWYGGICQRHYREARGIKYGKTR